MKNNIFKRTLIIILKLFLEDYKKKAKKII